LRFIGFTSTRKQVPRTWISPAGVITTKEFAMLDSIKDIAGALGDGRATRAIESTS